MKRYKTVLIGTLSFPGLCAGFVLLCISWVGCLCFAEATRWLDPEEACTIVDTIMSSRPGCTREGCGQALADVDCIAAFRGSKQRKPIPVAIVPVDSDGVPIAGGAVVLPRDRCGGQYAVSVPKRNGFQQFVEIRLLRDAPQRYRFLAGLRILQKSNGKVVGSGGTGCGAIRSGTLELKDGRWMPTFEAPSNFPHSAGSKATPSRGGNIRD